MLKAQFFEIGVEIQKARQKWYKGNQGGLEPVFVNFFYKSLYVYRMLFWNPNLVDIGVEVQKVGRKWYKGDQGGTKLVVWGTFFTTDLSTFMDCVFLA
jgi:hypothetical protein